MKKRRIVLLVVLFWSLVLILTIFGCKQSPTGPQVTPDVELSLDYATCTEVALKIGFTDSPGGGDYTIARNGTIVLAGTFTGSQGEIYDTTVLANKMYTYSANRLVNRQVKEISPQLQVMTPDSTSHNFTWQTFLLGDGNSSMLNSVTIVDDTLVYAAGQIYFRDSTGYYNLFNLCRWDGSHWNFMQLKFFPPNAVGDSTWGAGQAIFANGPNDIWFVAGTVFHFDGMRWTPIYNTGADAADAIWSNGSGQTWFVTWNGAIVTYNGSSWLPIASGTSAYFEDVWGAGGKILAATNAGSLLSVSTSPAIDTLNWTSGTIAGIWFQNNSPTYVSTSGIWSNDGRGWTQMMGPPDVFYGEIRGNASNDIFVSAPYGLVVHYNGSSWHVYPELSNSNWVFAWLATKNDVVATVGHELVSINGQAVAVIGTRTK